MKNRGVIKQLVLVMASSTLVLPAMAVDSSTTSEVKEPTKEELKNSKNRGLYIDPIVKKKKSTKPPTKAKAKTKTKAKRKKSSFKKKRSKVTTKSAKTTKTKKTKTVKKIAPPSRTMTVVGKKKSNIQKASLKSSDIKRVSLKSKSNIVAASLNKPGTAPRYKHGEKLKVTVKAYEDCNLMIFNFNGQELTQIFPNDYQKNPYLKAGSCVDVGGKSSDFDFLVSNDGKKPNSEKIFVYAYPVGEKAEPITVAMKKPEASPFRSTKMTIEQYRDLVNNSKSFFSRSVKVVAKKKTKLSDNPKLDPPPNKLELSLVIDHR